MFSALRRIGKKAKEGKVNALGPEPSSVPEAASSKEQPNAARLEAQGRLEFAEEGCSRLYTANKAFAEDITKLQHEMDLWEVDMTDHEEDVASLHGHQNDLSLAVSITESTYNEMHKTAREVIEGHEGRKKAEEAARDRKSEIAEYLQRLKIIDQYDPALPHIAAKVHLLIACLDNVYNANKVLKSPEIAEHLHKSADRFRGVDTPHKASFFFAKLAMHETPEKLLSRQQEEDRDLTRLCYHTRQPFPGKKPAVPAELQEMCKPDDADDEDGDEVPPFKITPQMIDDAISYALDAGRTSSHRITFRGCKVLGSNKCVNCQGFENPAEVDRAIKMTVNMMKGDPRYHHILHRHPEMKKWIEDED